MPIKLLSVVCLILCSSCAITQTDTIVVDLSNQTVQPKHYFVPFSSDSIKIDGIADETAWQFSKYSDRFVDIEGVKEVAYDTRFKMLWSKEYLYLFAYLEEPHVWGDLHQRDTVIFYNNDFEVFIDPSNDTRNYAEIEINALGTVWDLLLDKPYRVGGRAINEFNIHGLKTAVSVNGTINDSGDKDSSWCVEMAIPMKALVQLKVKPQSIPSEGEVWRINFSRVQWEHSLVNVTYKRKRANGSYLPEMNWVWSPQGVINMHEPEKWGYLHFSNSAGEEHTIDTDQIQLNQIGYALFREFRFRRKTVIKEMLAGQSLLIQLEGDSKLSSQVKNARFIKTHVGFEVIYEESSSGSKFVIDQEGHLRKL